MPPATGDDDSEDTTVGTGVDEDQFRDAETPGTEPDSVNEIDGAANTEGEVDPGRSPDETETATERDDTPVGSESVPAADEQYCSSCGSVIKQEAAICPECGVEQDGSDDGDPGVAALLSGVGFLIPIAAGAGQVYNGDLAKGIILSVIQIVNALLLFVAIGFITYPIVGIYAIYDAYKNG